MIKTHAMAIREIDSGGAGSNLPYINSTNELVGSCSSLKAFFCEYGVTVGATYTTIASAIGDYSISALNASVSVTNNRITTDFAAVANAGDTLTIGATDDWLILVAGEPKSTTTNRLVFSFTGSSTAVIRTTTNVANATLSVLDDTPTTVTCAAIGAATNDQTYTIYTKCDRSSATGVSRNRNQTTVASIATPTTADATALTTTITLDISSGSVIFSGAIAAAAIFVFPSGTLPANVDAMAKWMGAQWAAGNYVLPNGW